ncbi:glycosyl hydrolase family 8 [Geomicrobium sp. JCM 19038]|uniref:glycosyl hydrolase family 8 n=1 Tax=Geomicrobium sp. JCM 19038 TaxID=1460635 RepID=UPI00045F179F|nr:glycosyl hydrolase family 8 [Geomicrobium sp. JCM 19038]GAK08439.1 hypothetical protein JCM19038_2222 [Geomicrobium sp. JCM 19038]
MNNDERPMTERFIHEWFLNDDGTFATYIVDGDQLDEDLVAGREALSETIGLLMEYALLRDDHSLFQEYVEDFEESFLEEDGMIYWKLTPGASEHVSTNALIDDIRIAYAFMNAYERYGETEYREISRVITHQLNSRYQDAEVYTDFYDTKHDYASSVITLSYIDRFALEILHHDNQLDETLYQNTIHILEEAPIQNGFYPKSYNVEQAEYEFDQEVNMVDQMIIAYHESKAGMRSNELLDFIRDEFERRGVIHGIYDLKTKTPLVDYESPALYGFTIMYLLEIEEYEFAESVYERMIQFRNEDTSDPYYGGYTVINGDTHIFDNLVPLLAEQQLKKIGM